MIRSKLIYLAVIVSLVLFFILCVEPLALVMLLVLLVFPLFLWLTLRGSTSDMSVSLQIPSAAGSRGESIPYEIDVYKAHRLPVSCRLTLRVQNVFTGEILTQTLALSTSDSQHHCSGELTSRHCGQVSVSLEHAYAYDFFYLFRRKLPCGEEQHIIVLPALNEINGTLTTMPAFDAESDLFSKEKSGDDPSELFDIRTYQDGDRLQRIHWNLSSKTDGFLVKEYSLPLSNSITILLEQTAPDADLSDAVLELLLSLSNFLLEQQVPHEICWHSSANGFCTYSVNSSDDLYSLLGQLLSSPHPVSEEDVHPALTGYLNAEEHLHTHLIYLTADSTAVENPLLRAHPVPVTAMLVQADADGVLLEDDDFRCIPVQADALAQSLAELEL